MVASPPFMERRLALSEPKFCGDCGAATVRRIVKDGDPARVLCGECARVYYAGPRLAAGVICARGPDILLAQRGIEPGYGKWGYPGGFVDLGESPAEGAVREALEEAGAIVDLRGLVGVYHNRERAVVVTVYAGELAPGCEPSAKDETLAVKFVGRDRVPFDELAFDSTRAAFRDFLRGTAREVSA